MKIKVCGITNLEDALLCQRYGADALGFIFYPGSKRCINPDIVADIIPHLSIFVVKVGVFVNESAAEINRIADHTGLTAVQIHGDEGPEIVEKLNRPVIKSFRVNQDFDFSVLSHYRKCIYLLDTFSEKEYGGTGKPFDWRLIPAGLCHKIILAGGVSIDNIETLYNICPAAVDLSSSLEESPGKKDPEKVKEFFAKIQRLKMLDARR